MSKCVDCLVVMDCPQTETARAAIQEFDNSCSTYIKGDPLQMVEKEEAGKKITEGKMGWYAMPLVMLKPLADVFTAGVGHYGLFNILGKFENPKEDFYNAIMRHLEECQINPLARDSQDGCYHAAKVAFNALAWLYHCSRAKA